MLSVATPLCVGVSEPGLSFEPRPQAFGFSLEILDSGLLLSSQLNKAQFKNGVYEKWKRCTKTVLPLNCCTCLVESSAVFRHLTGSTSVAAHPFLNSLVHWSPFTTLLNIRIQSFNVCGLRTGVRDGFLLLDLFWQVLLSCLWCGPSWVEWSRLYSAEFSSESVVLFSNEPHVWNA